ncbi:MAG: (deoxy)nucleoside triphosphate pyrophosphohydrolase [Bacteroidales bacterium]|nr:(deoxy)nucleoside triphosphate pyrophosphohydrolase [Bacteroidales bacterium]
MLVGLPVSFLTSDHTTTGPVVVVAAIIRDEEGRIFATQRGYGDFNDFWEFPGGKIEAGESADQALRREIWEELQTRIVVERLFRTVEYDYPQFQLSMQCFLCRIESGHPVLLEHEAARWLSPAELDSVEWFPADR